MAWNEPGKSNKPEGQPEGPPELDKVFKALGEKVSALFGSKPKKPDLSGGTPPTGGSSKPAMSYSLQPIVLGIVAVILVIWFLSGIFIVAPAEKSVILQFGKYKEMVGSGPHWIPQFIDTQTKVNVQNIANYSYQAQMLTKDQNIVDVSVAVQYRIADAKDYLFSVTNPVQSLQEATASALRQVIGNTTLDQVLTTGRATVRQEVVDQLQKILAPYNTGIQITDVALQPARAPVEVKAAFDDAIKAQEDEQRYQNQAETYSNSVVPDAQGKAKRLIQEAQAYQQQVVLKAQGDVARFNAVYDVYRQAPVVTKERMYLAALENVYQNSSKVFVDVKGNNNVLYLPLEAALSQIQRASPPMSNTTNDVLNAQNAISQMISNNTQSTGASDMPSNIANPDSIVGRGDRP